MGFQATILISVGVQGQTCDRGFRDGWCCILPSTRLTRTGLKPARPKSSKWKTNQVVVDYFYFLVASFFHIGFWIVCQLIICTVNRPVPCFLFCCTLVQTRPLAEQPRLFVLPISAVDAHFYAKKKLSRIEYAYLIISIFLANAVLLYRKRLLSWKFLSQSIGFAGSSSYLMSAPSSLAVSQASRLPSSTFLDRPRLSGRPLTSGATWLFFLSR